MTTAKYQPRPAQGKAVPAVVKIDRYDKRLPDFIKSRTWTKRNFEDETPVRAEAILAGVSKAGVGVEIKLYLGGRMTIALPGKQSFLEGFLIPKAK